MISFYSDKNVYKYIDIINDIWYSFARKQDFVMIDLRVLITSNRENEECNGKYQPFNEECNEFYCSNYPI
jgi:hypothetical protein